MLFEVIQGDRFWYLRLAVSH